MSIESLKLGLSLISLLLIIAAVISMTHPNTNPTLGTNEPKKPSLLYRKLKHTNLLSTKKMVLPTFCIVNRFGYTVNSCTVGNTDHGRMDTGTNFVYNRCIHGIYFFELSYSQKRIRYP